ncbi:AAA family ATPase [Pseudomonas sp. PDM13]|uniref:AAA family ATPase n=1 Tax=Pseudomonas sp. PDM13 TaxID=2769255 RepID=UPI0021E01DAC|nr:AAA family ATPase [Pseudomonas sp. PDM13]MCU9949819.1 AAA family ATPase [Pseudomonas sp. PDM13]
MRLDRILVENVLGLRSADLALRTPITLVAGPNGAGKSSLGDAVSMALLGRPRRVAKKKDLAQLVSEGAKRGRAAIWADGEQMGEMKLPSGDHGEHLPAGAQYLPYVLDSTLFATGSADDRRRLLFQLTNCKATPDLIEKRLLELGAQPDKVATIKPLLLSGFPAASEDAKARATDAKGAWRGVTGEVWGEVKADGWEPELPAASVDQQDLANSQKELQQVEQDLADAQEALGAHRANGQNNAQRQAKVAELVPEADLLARRRVKLEEDRKRQLEWSQKLVDAEQAASVATALTCPCCSELLVMEDGKLMKLPTVPGADAAEAAKRVAEYEGYLQSAMRAIDNSLRDVASSEAAVKQIKELKAELAAEVSAEAIETAEQAINDLRQQRDALRAKVEALQEVARAIADRQAVIDKAARHHADVVTWSLIGDALAPAGIPAKLLGEALAPVNDSLAILARLAKWRPVVIGNDMALTYGDRAYGLLSESERWRVDTLVALAIAQLSELRVVLLDRFDVLDLPSRTQMLVLLLELAKIKAIDSVVLCGTLKEPPAKLPAPIAAYWIESGAIVQPSTSQAA